MLLSTDRMSTSSEPILPLVHDNDSFEISIEVLSPSRVRILTIIRHENNANNTGTLISFRDLSPDTKRAVIQQVNRRYIGRSVDA